jgi:hypothetical protein
VAFAIASTVAVAQHPAATSAPVTFTKDVAPILYRSCVRCHRPDEIAPMSLLTYNDARPWARSMKQRVSKREMPPWFLDKTIEAVTTATFTKPGNYLLRGVANDGELTDQKDVRVNAPSNRF